MKRTEVIEAVMKKDVESGRGRKEIWRARK